MNDHIKFDELIRRLDNLTKAIHLNLMFLANNGIEMAINYDLDNLYKRYENLLSDLGYYFSGDYYEHYVNSLKDMRSIHEFIVRSNGGIDCGCDSK